MQDYDYFLDKSYVFPEYNLKKNIEQNRITTGNYFQKNK